MNSGNVVPSMKMFRCTLSRGLSTAKASAKFFKGRNLRNDAQRGASGPGPGFCYRTNRGGPIGPATGKGMCSNTEARPYQSAPASASPSPLHHHCICMLDTSAAAPRNIPTQKSDVELALKALPGPAPACWQ